jgi:hypothetical protein
MQSDKLPITISEDEERELRQGQDLYEMTKTSGWAVIEQWMKDLAFHSWVDPREIENSHDSQKEYLWRELNAFYAANNARELLERVQKVINQSEYLHKVKTGEIKRGVAMKI